MSLQDWSAHVDLAVCGLYNLLMRFTLFRLNPNWILDGRD
jgi:hypothetical protein